MQDNQQASLINISEDYFLTTEISALETTVLEAARRTVERDMGAQGVVLTDTEREAVLTVQVLKELNSVDLATLLLRYKYFKKIRDGNMATRHPGQYGSLTALANDQGISTSELSRIVDLVEIVFPFLWGRLGLDIPALWKDIGKSNFMEMLPVLKVLITGQDADHSDQANQAAQRFLDDAAASYRAQNQEVPAEDVLREGVVRDIVDHGVLLNNRELRTHIRPERTPSIASYFITGRNGQNYLLSTLSNDQLTMLSRRAGSVMDIVNVTSDQAVNFAEVRDFLRAVGIS